MPAIELIDLTKSYGKRLAVDHLSFDVQTGEVFGFVGPNGAGKTTTMRILAGLLKATSGEVRVDGHPVHTDPNEVHRRVGYMPDFFGVYPDLKVWEYLDFFAGCYNIPAGQRPMLIDGLLELVDLPHRREDQVDRLSRGMKQRLSLARALIHEPSVLLLDEPASGLDPRARVEIRELLVELASMGKTIFFSTHILADVAEICNRVAIIEGGQLVAVGSLEELHLLVMPTRRIEVTLLDGLEKAREYLAAQAGVQSVEPQPSSPSNHYHRLALEFAGDDQGASGLLSGLVSLGLPVLHFNTDQRDLEEVFLRATQGKVT
jgi:ABC-2 type transport system ATP-binding protein